jgi:catechol 2,3-dioxygenase-like lactoylglutathione lyase family enzyme
LYIICSWLLRRVAFPVRQPAGRRAGKKVASEIGGRFLFPLAVNDAPREVPKKAFFNNSYITVRMRIKMEIFNTLNFPPEATLLFYKMPGFVDFFKLVKQTSVLLKFDRALAIMKARGIELVKYSEEGHTTFPGRHAYFHDADGNGIEIIDLYKK